MKPQYYTIPARIHPPLTPKTADVMHTLDCVRNARNGDIIAVSALYRVSDTGSAQNLGLAQAWVVAENGVYPRSIFDVRPDQVAAASTTMIFSEQDAVLASIGGGLGDVLGKTPQEAVDHNIYLICLECGLVALRSPPVITRARRSDQLEDILPSSLCPSFPVDCQNTRLSRSCTICLSFFHVFFFNRNGKPHPTQTRHPGSVDKDYRQAARAG